MSQIESIEWMAYPENKPEPDGKEWRVFLTTNQQPNGLFANRNTYFYKDEQWEYNEDMFPVIAFAEPPKGYDPLAKTFNFMTALARMKAGKKCRSLVTMGRYYYSHPEGIEAAIRRVMAGGSLVAYLTLAEIEGDWSEA